MSLKIKKILRTEVIIKVEEDLNSKTGSQAQVITEKERVKIQPESIEKEEITWQNLSVTFKIFLLCFPHKVPTAIIKEPSME